MIDWNKPLETTDGLPIVAVIQNYRLAPSVFRTAVIVAKELSDVFHLVDPITGCSNYDGGIDVRNIQDA